MGKERKMGEGFISNAAMATEQAPAIGFLACIRCQTHPPCRCIFVKGPAAVQAEKIDREIRVVSP